MGLTRSLSLDQPGQAETVTNFPPQTNPRRPTHIDRFSGFGIGGAGGVQPQALPAPPCFKCV